MSAEPVFHAPGCPRAVHPPPVRLRCFSATAAVGRPRRAASHSGGGHHATDTVPCEPEQLGSLERSARVLLPVPVTVALESGSPSLPSSRDTLPRGAGRARRKGGGARARRPCPRAQEGAGYVGHVRRVPESAAAKAASPGREGAARQGDAQGAAARPRGGAGAAAVAGRERERHGSGGRGGTGGTAERRAAEAAASRAQGADDGVGQGSGGGGTSGA